MSNNKVPINLVAEVLKKEQVEPAKLRAIIEELQLVLENDVAEESTPPIKKQWALIISDPAGRLPDIDFVGWAVQLPEEESVATVLERVYRGVHEFNTTKRGRLMPVKTVGDALETVPAKHFKEAQLWVKTREPVLVIKSNNLIPTETKE